MLGSVGVARSSYYRWRKGQGEKTEPRQSSYQITEDERRLIEEVKEAHPEYRHRRIQGVLQSKGVYLSASAIYRRISGKMSHWLFKEDFLTTNNPWSSRNQASSLDAMAVADPRSAVF